MQVWLNKIKNQIIMDLVTGTNRYENGRKQCQGKTASYFNANDFYLRYYYILFKKYIIWKGQMGAELQNVKRQKIHFIIHKKVEFGKALYVIGNIPELGSWNVQNCCRLCWAKDDYWTGFITIAANELKSPIEYKYIVANYENPAHGRIDWEAGALNRILEGPLDSQHIICENKWNIEKITLNLMVPDEGKNQQYSVIGNCKELGSWKKSFKMVLNKKKNLTVRQNIKLMDNDQKHAVYSFTFQIYRGKPKIHYYYIKKTTSSEMERQPGRKYELQSGFNSHPKCLKVAHTRGDTELYQVCNFKELNFSKVTEDILLGPYLRTPEDFKLLKEEGVSSVLSIQTNQDISMHCLTEDYLLKLSKQNEIELFTYAIQDMNKKDFLTKCQGPVDMLKKLVRDHKKVYVHCSAGVYRSPQIVALFLIVTRDFTPEKAVQYVKSRHPFAKPNTQIVSHAMEMLSRSSKLNAYSFPS